MSAVRLSLPGPAARRLADERGITMVEILVASLILVIVALGTASAFVSANAMTGAGEARAVALDAAQQEQQQLRGRALTQLVGTTVTDTATVDGVPYTLSTELGWVVDGKGADACSATEGVSRRIQLVTTATSSIVGGTGPGSTAPIVVRSTVAPSAGGLSTAGAVLIAKVAGASETTPVVGLGVTFSSPGLTRTVATNDAGCAILPGAPAGTYSVSASRSGWVDDNGRSTLSGSVTAVTGGVAGTGTLRYAEAARVTVNYGASDGTRRRAGYGNGATWISPDGKSGTSGVSGAVSSTTLTGLFPYADGYQVRPSPCVSSAGTTTPAAVTPGGTTSIDVSEGHVRVRQRSNTVGWPANTEVILRSLDSGCTLRLVGTTYQTGGILDRQGLPDRSIPFGRYRACLKARSNGRDGRDYAKPVDFDLTTQVIDPPTDVIIPVPGSDGDYVTAAACA